MDIATASKQYQEANELFLDLVNSLDEQSLDKSDGEGWTPRQVIHHVADSEAQSYARLRRLIAEPGTMIQGYDEGAWSENATLGYSELPIGISVAVYTAVRASSLENYINHPRDHASQIQKILS